MPRDIIVHFEPFRLDLRFAPEFSLPEYLAVLVDDRILAEDSRRVAVCDLPRQSHDKRVVVEHVADMEYPRALVSKRYDLALVLLVRLLAHLLGLGGLVVLDVVEDDEVWAVLLVAQTLETLLDGHDGDPRVLLGEDYRLRTPFLRVVLEWS